MATEHAMDRVDERELQNTLASRLRYWSQAGNALQRLFEFPDFKSALAFVNAVGEKAEMLGHHPDIDIRYNRVKLSLTSHDAGGITRRDLILASYIDEIISGYEARKTA